MQMLLSLCVATAGGAPELRPRVPGERMAIELARGGRRMLQRECVWVKAGVLLQGGRALAADGEACR